MGKKNKKIIFGAICGFIILLMSFVLILSVNDFPPETPVGYEFINDSVHVWNPVDDYYFDRDTGIQFTNHYEDYWTKNVFCIGYYSNGDWNKIACADELSGFNRQIETDNLTYVNATLWKDISYETYDIRLAVNYLLELNDENLSVTIYGKNIGQDIPFDLGFAWKVQNINITGEGQDFIEINGSVYYLNESNDLLFKNMDEATFNIRDTTKYLILGWDKNLNYAVKMYGDGNQDNFYVATLVNAGHFNPGQEKQTTFEWIDADVAIDTSTNNYLEIYQDGICGPYWINSTTGVIVFSDSVSELHYKSTTNGGSSWNDKGDISPNHVTNFACWYDKETPSDDGALLHLAWLDYTVNYTYYATINLSNFSLSSIHEVDTSNSIYYNTVIGAYGGRNRVGISKSLSGNIMVCHSTYNGELECYKSYNGGNSWSDVADVFESTATYDWALLYPANTGDGDDFAAIYKDYSSSELSVKVYDNSSNNWGETFLFDIGTPSSTQYFEMDAAVRHSDNHILLVSDVEGDTVTDDVITFDISPNTTSSIWFQRKTNVTSDQSESRQVSVMIDQFTDDVYVGRLKGTSWFSTVDVVYYKSADDMSSWSSEQTYSEGTSDNLVEISGGRTVGGGTNSGLIQFSWFNDDLNDIFVNVGNSVEILPPETNPPYFTSIPSNFSDEYGVAISADFDAEDDRAFNMFYINDTTWFTMENSTGTLTNNSPLAVGNYAINVSINDSSNNINWTIFTAEVTKNTNACDIILNDTSPLTYPEILLIHTNCGPDYQIKLNGTNINNNSILNSGVGGYNISVERTDTSNYTNIYDESIVSILLSSDNCQVLFNETSPHLNNTAFSVYTDCTSDFQIYRNGTTVNNNSVQYPLDAGYYNYSVQRTDVLNFTNTFDDEWFNITADLIHPLIDYVNPTENNNENKSQNWVFVNVSITEDNFESVTFYLYDSAGTLDSSQQYTNSVREHNFTGLSDGFYYYNVTTLDTSGNSNSTDTRKIGLDNSGPAINLMLPIAQTYATNVSLELNFTANDSVSGTDMCWFEVVDLTNYRVIDNVTINNCINTTFNVTNGTGSYTLRLYSNDTLGQESLSSVLFSISLEGPAINLGHPTNASYLDYSTNVDMNFTATDIDGLSQCQLWGSWNGGWHLNYTWDEPTNDTQNTTDVNLSDGNYIYNIWCNDTSDNSNWASDNYTFTIDTTLPYPDIISITTTVGSQDISFVANASDANTDTCFYTILDATNAVDGANDNVTFTCNQSKSASVSSFASYTLWVYVNDSAGNINNTFSSFTTSASSPPAPTGGGGGSLPLPTTDFGFCGDLICQDGTGNTTNRGETFYNCPEDCAVRFTLENFNLDTVLLNCLEESTSNECLWKTNPGLLVIFVFVAGIFLFTLFFEIIPDRKGKNKIVYVSPIKKKRRRR